MRISNLKNNRLRRWQNKNWFNNDYPSNIKNTVMSFQKLLLMNCPHTNLMTIRFTLRRELTQNRLLDTVLSISSHEKSWKLLKNMWLTIYSKDLLDPAQHPMPHQSWWPGSQVEAYNSVWTTGSWTWSLGKTIIWYLWLMSWWSDWVMPKYI